MVRYKTIIELITDGDTADEAIDRAGEYLRGSYNGDMPLKVKTQPMASRNLRMLSYTISICFVLLSFSFVWFAAGRSYQKLVATKDKAVETYAVNPPASTDAKTKAGKDLKKKWDEVYKQKVLYERDSNIDTE